MSDPMGPPEEADSLQSYAERLRLLVDAGLFVARELHLDEVLDRIASSERQTVLSEPEHFVEAQRRAA